VRAAEVVEEVEFVDAEDGDDEVPSFTASEDIEQLDDEQQQKG
jgi:hypothetical protein